MKHTDFDWLALIEKRLAPAARQRAEAHLAACPACRAEFAALADVAAELKRLPAALVVPARPAQWMAVWARVQRPAPTYPLRPLAACLSLLVVVVLFAHSWPAHPTSPALGLAAPQHVAHMAETPRPPGSRLVSTAATQPLRAEAASATFTPRVAPIATPVPGPRS